MNLLKIIQNVFTQQSNLKKIEELKKELVDNKVEAEKVIRTLNKKEKRDNKYIRRLIVKLKESDPEGKDAIIRTLTTKIITLQGNNI